MTDSILKLQAVKIVCGLCKSALYEAVKRGEFPPPLRLSARAVGWRASDIERWLETRQPSINTSKLWAEDEARELLIKQVGDEMLAAAKAGDMAKAKQLKDFMYAEINHRSLQFIKRRHAEIDQAIGMTTTIGQSHEERLSAIKVVE